jgi:hypothetical protein
MARPDKILILPLMKEVVIPISITCQHLIGVHPVIQDASVVTTAWTMKFFKYRLFVELQVSPKGDRKTVLPEGKGGFRI